MTLEELLIQAIQAEAQVDVSSIKKGTKLLVNNGLGTCNAIAMESGKQGRGTKKTILVDIKASEVGFFDEMGSIYVSDIIAILD